ncbi:MAG: serine--tRNA ligase [Buchnera aphidicola (Periphyllus acericola)]|uniref:serine--tRNA ligase n=1 Tax=Buchnera aphidicola TaxID=9 RepID=UPI0030D614B3|nr:serine--tRNA ligase [Buchnera aphidicola (Periphyllus acericola)]
MINIKILRKSIDKTAVKLLKKGFILNVKKFNKLEKKRKKIQIITENFRSIQKNISKKIGNIKNLENKKKYLKKNKKISKKINKYNKKFYKIKKKIHNFMIKIPNILSKDVHFGETSFDNKIIYNYGKFKKMDFEIKNHVDLGNNINGFNWHASTKITGSNFVIMQGNLSKLYRILSQFMLDLHISFHKYQEIYVPYIVNENSIYGTGQYPKFKSDLFFINSKKNKKQKKYFLIPTAEVPLTNLVKNTILKKSDLPCMFVANTPCFRSESKSYGKKFQGLIRLHQFDKVELVQITHPKNSSTALEEITSHAEKVLQLLKLPYRKVLLCSKETNFSSKKTYDLEVWFPSQNTYKEISSCSNMSDFQARRIKARYFDIKKNKNLYVHTLNGSGLAIGRTLAAILENYQLKDGSIKIPKILRKKYMNGLKILK